ncbi:hypothetical protein [Streptomyces cacaoi]|uniref:hypothetical protein n=1 Tax=Streptomyces cacaoi TaxID=1898 RepID=UPI0026200ADC|nr:hypothetical protein [Streptomyces cacaoi]
MKRRALTYSLISTTACLLLVAGLMTWWNTNFLGPDTFCDGALARSDVEAALEGKGRVTESGSPDPSSYALRCEVARSSRFIDSPQPEFKVSFDPLSGAAVFQSRVWQSRGGMSLAREGLPAGATDRRAWLLLPSSCWKKIPARSAAIPFVTTELKEGSARPQALLRITQLAAQRVMERAGCPETPASSEAAVDAAPAPEKKKETDPQRVCGIPGFTLPKEVLLPGSVELGTERTTSAKGKARLCELHLRGKNHPGITLSISDNKDVVAAVQKEDPAITLGETEILTCSDGELYVGLWANDSYKDAFLDNAAKGRSPRSDVFDDLVTTLATSQAEARGWQGCGS